MTLTGLEEQLLVSVVSVERPDLELKNGQLVVNIAADQKALKDTEDKILHLLANSSGNILDDGELMRGEKSTDSS